jgi:hypothetical protein
VLAHCVVRVVGREAADRGVERNEGLSRVHLGWDLLGGRLSNQFYNEFKGLGLAIPLRPDP